MSFVIGANIQLGIRPKSFSFDSAANQVIDWLTTPAGRAPTRRS